MELALSYNVKSLLHIVITLFLGLAISLPLSANQGDWVMVERFNKQHELAKQGNVKAMYAVGKLYERGRGVKKDLTKAVEWYQKAASAGQTSAQSRLGIMYFEGRGVKQNYKKALQLLNKAAKDNVPSAQFQLANMYELGAGVPQDLKKAIHWYKESDKYGYYLAKAKVERLSKLLRSGGTIKRKTTTQSVATAKKAASPLIQTLSSGKWFKRKKPVGYLPSAITNCAKEAYNTMRCISTSQERSTGSEIISYNTESIITAKNKTSFSVAYSNNVLDVALLSVEDGDGEVIEQVPSRIKKGEGKQRRMKCVVKGKSTISCTKGSSSFDLVKR